MRNWQLEGLLCWQAAGTFAACAVCKAATHTPSLVHQPLEWQDSRSKHPQAKLTAPYACPYGVQGEKGWTVAALQAGARECGLSPAAAALVSDNEAGLVQVSSRGLSLPACSPVEDLVRPLYHSSSSAQHCMLQSSGA